MSPTSFYETMCRLSAAPNYRHPSLTSVLRASELVSQGEESRARKLVSELLDRNTGSSVAAERLARLFAQSLEARLQGDLSGTGNLYEEATSPQDMLEAFQMLVGATPFIRFGYSVANSAILNAVARSKRIHLLDIGIGSGSQWFAFLDALASRLDGRECTIHLTGIDVPSAGNDPESRLRMVGVKLSDYAAELGIGLTFAPVASRAEEIDFQALVEPLQHTHALAINAAFALHHLPTADHPEEADRSRDAVLRRLQALSPRVFAIIEPDVEHNALRFRSRVAESMGHYLTVFDALDNCLADHPRERSLLENAFFGSEIRNIIIGEGRDRVERHERHTSWHRRLSSAGFSPMGIGSLAKGLELRGPFAVRPHRDALTLHWKGVSLIAASAWTTTD